MLDYVKISTKIPSVNDWQKETGLQLAKMVNTLSNETIGFNGKNSQVFVYTGSTESYRYKIIEKESPSGVKNDCQLIIGGSLHKALHGENYSRFAWSDLQQEIYNIQKVFNIDVNQALLHNLEIGVNIKVPFSPFPFLESNLLSYKGKERRKYSPNKVNGSVIGFEFPLRQYRVKIYDKGMQNQLGYELMRFEIHYSKMQPISRSIGALTLSDLQLKERVACLLPIFSKAWNNILLYDDSIDFNCLGQQEAHLLSFGRSLQNWQNLKKRNLAKYKNDMQKFKKLVAANGGQNHKMIHDLICAEWEWLINN